MSVINWTDTVTPLNAANMNALEQTVRKGAANGYAGLDATSKVPLAQTPLSPVTNGQWLKGVGGVPVWAAIAAADLPPQAVPGYGTTLPASPSDGQMAILVDSLTNPTYQWKFRYNASSTSPYKWEFVGGPPLQMGYAAGVAMNNAAFATSGGWYWHDPNTVAAVPRAGDYEVRANASPGATVAAQVTLAVGNVTVPTIPANAAARSDGTVNNGYSPGSVFARLLGVAAGAKLGLAWMSTVIASSTINFTTVQIFPVRVS